MTQKRERVREREDEKKYTGKEGVREREKLGNVMDQEKEEMSRRVKGKENGESDVYWLLPSLHE